jgi:electron transfer flavoprotein alpha subunit
MVDNILFLAHVDESGSGLPKAAYEALGAALDIAAQLGATVTIGLIGEDVRTSADSVAATGARILAACGSDFAHPRYASDAAALEGICREVSPQIVIAPATSRFQRVLPGLTHRLEGCIDTHITSLSLVDGILTANRWFYRQRLEAAIQRQTRPWPSIPGAMPRGVESARRQTFTRSTPRLLSKLNGRHSKE